MRGGALTSITTLAFNLALIPFVLDRLGPSVYGAWVALVAVMAVVALADTGIRTEVARRVATAHGTRSRDASCRHRPRRHHGDLPAGGTGAGARAGVHAAAGGPGVSRGVSGIPTGDLHLLMRGLFLNVALVLVLDAHFAVLRGIQRSDVEARAQQLALLVNAAITVGGILAGWSIWALFWAYLASTLGAASRAVARRTALVPELRLRSGAVRRSTVVGYLSLSSLAVFSQVGDVIDSQWDKVVLSRYVDQEAVAAFHVGTSLVLQGKVLAVLPLVPIMVAVAELRSSDPARAPLLQRKLMKIGAVASSVVAGRPLRVQPRLHRHLARRRVRRHRPGGPAVHRRRGREPRRRARRDAGLRRGAAPARRGCGAGQHGGERGAQPRPEPSRSGSSERSSARSPGMSPAPRSSWSSCADT